MYKFEITCMILILCLFNFQVHDFGFFRYDPAAIQFLNYEEIPLAPDAACVGLEIRVVGNDSGEKVYINLVYGDYDYLNDSQSDSGVRMVLAHVI